MAQSGIKTSEDVKAIEGFQPVANVIDDIVEMNAGKANMYDIATELISLAWTIDQLQEDPETNADEIATLYDQFETLLDGSSKKFDDAVFVLKDMESRIDTLGKMAADLAKKKKSQTNAMERFKDYLQYIGKSNPQALKGQVYKGHIIEKQSVDSNYDTELLPDNFLREKITTSLDKKLVLEYFKDRGEAVPGTNILIKTHLRIT